MAYENGKTYWFISHSGTGRALSVYGNSQVSQNRNVILWDKQSVNDQKWLVSIYNGFGRIRSALDNSYALNIWTGGNNPNNCDIHSWADNQNDSKVDFLTVSASENLYKIKLLNYNLLMTATGSANGNDVRWQAPNGASNQIWKLVDVSGGGVTPSVKNYQFPLAINNYTTVTGGEYGASRPSGTHDGYDFACSAGTPILAMASGTVVIADLGTVAKYGTGMDTVGNFVTIDHDLEASAPNGKRFLRSFYLHMRDFPLVKSGQYVTKGKQIGVVGSTGASTGNHLHFGIQAKSSAMVFDSTKYRDPSASWVNPISFYNTSSKPYQPL